MSFETLASIDLASCGRLQLRAFVKLARREWNRTIDLRSATAADLIEYLQMYLAFKAETDAVVPPHTLSGFEGIDDVTMAATDWLNATPLSCDVCGYQTCELPLTPQELTEALTPLAHDFEDKPTASAAWERCFAEKLPPESFTAAVRINIDNLLLFGAAHGNTLSSDWLRGIAWDCISIATGNKDAISQVKERRLLDDNVYYGLAGFSSPADCASLEKDKAFTLIRRNFDHLQEELNISGLKTRDYCINAEPFTTLLQDGLLMLVDDDLLRLKAEVPRIIAYFKAVTGDSYNLEVEVETDDGEEERHEVTEQDLDWEAIEEYSESAYLYARNDDHIELAFKRWDYAADEFSSFFRLLATRSWSS